MIDSLSLSDMTLDSILSDLSSLLIISLSSWDSNINIKSITFFEIFPSFKT